MAKNRRDKKTRAARRNVARVLPTARNRNIVLISVLGVFVVAIIAVLILGSDSTSRSSRDSGSSVNSSEIARAEQAQAPASAGHGPSIQFPESEFDFGSIAQGAKVSHTFVVQNKGDEPLKLIRAHGS